jgi:hypothetical protein
MTIFYCLRFETTATWWARSLYLYPPGTGWPSYTPRHWIPFSSPLTSRRAAVEVFDPASTRATLQLTWVSGYIASGLTTAQKTRPLPSNGRPLLLCIRGNVFTESLLSNGHGADPHRKHLLQHLFYCCVSVLRTLLNNGSTLLLVVYLLRACLQSRCLAMGTCVTI